MRIPAVLLCLMAVLAVSMDTSAMNTAATDTIAAESMPAYTTVAIAALDTMAADTAAVDTAASDTAKAVRKEVIALKNNLAYDAVLTPNLEMEIVLSPRWSIELGAGFNPFPLDDTRFPKWRHLAAWIAPRYWFCHVFHRDFLSFNAAYAHYNVAGDAWPVSWMYKQVKESRYEGDAVMAGISYGWHFALSPHFSLELEGGVEAGYSWYRQFECKHCGAQKSQGGRWLVLPKLGVNISIPLGGDELSLARRCDCEKIDTAEPVDTVAPEPPDTVEAEPLEPFIPATRLSAPAMRPAPVLAYVPSFVPVTDNMIRLRSRLLRGEEEYETYSTDMALSADPRNVFIYFEVNVTKMDRSFIQNDLLMDSIMNILGSVREDSTVRISHIRIVGFASFDGKRAYNERLAGSRAQTIKEYMQSVYPLPDSVFAVCNGGESWAELRYGLSKVEFKGRDEVLEIIDTEPDPDMRERKIKALHGGGTYVYMRDELRHILRNLGCITIYIEDNE